ncbi:MAG: hypothetical protein H7099_13370 [Gemmatimonadaceae bacterium]|nr:hypothetical protein [Gemmatimonadaceae bacterium]
MTVGLVVEIEELVFDTLTMRTDALQLALTLEGVRVTHADVRRAHSGATAAMALDALGASAPMDMVARDLVLTRTATAMRAILDRGTPSFDAIARDRVVELSAEFPIAVVTRAGTVDAQRMLEESGLEACIRTIRSLGDLPEPAQHDVWAEARAALFTDRWIAVARRPLLSAARRAGFSTIAIDEAPAANDAALVSLAQLDASFPLSIS